MIDYDVIPTITAEILTVDIALWLVACGERGGSGVILTEYRVSKPGTHPFDSQAFDPLVL